MFQLGKALTVFLVLLCLLVGGAVGQPSDKQGLDDQIAEYLKQAEELLGAGEFDQAIEILLKAVELDPDLGIIHLYLGRSFLEQGEQLFKQALGEYKKALSDENVADEAHFELGKLYFARGLYQEALEEFGKMEGEKPVPKYTGISLFKLGEYAEALDCLEDASEAEPEDPEVLYYLGRVYEEKNLFDKALANYRALISLGPQISLVDEAERRIKAIERPEGELILEDIADQEVKELIKTAPGAEEYPNAGALILLREDEYVIEDDRMILTMHRVIKILNDRGKEKYGEVKIGFDSTHETTAFVLARTIKRDDTIVTVGKKDIREVTPWADFPLYSNYRVKIASMPEVLPGAVIEYKVVVTSRKLLAGDEFQFRFGTQFTEPYLLERLILIVPKGRRFDIHYVRFEEEPAIESLLEENYRYTWTIEDVPEIISEPDMPPWADISPLIWVSSFHSWKVVSDWWWGLAKGQMEVDEAIRAKVAELIQGKGTDFEKAKAIYQYVASQLRYVGIEFGESGFKPHRATEVFENKYGDCKDQAVLLVAMLKEAGIAANLVLISTKSNGKLVEGIPALQFNHAIAHVNIEGKDYWMDPTVETAALGELPGDDQDTEVLVFFPEGARFVHIPLFAPEENHVIEERTWSLDEQGALEGATTTTYFGEYAFALKYSFKYAKPVQRESYLQSVVNNAYPGGRLLDYEISDPTDQDLPFSIKMEYTAPEFLKRAGDQWILRIPGMGVSTSNVGKEERTYPLIFNNTLSLTRHIEIDLPEGFQVIYIPQNLELELPYATYNISYRSYGTSISIEEEYGRSQVEISVEEYPEFKEFVEEIARAVDETIILVEE